MHSTSDDEQTFALPLGGDLGGYMSFGDWFGLLISVMSMGFALFEFYKRKKGESFMLSFLHGLKPFVETLSKRSSVPGSEIEPMLQQINDALARLKR